MVARYLKTLKSRILFSTLFCFLAVGVPALLFLYSYMNSKVYEQVERINAQWIEGETENINTLLSSLIDTVAWISSDDNVQLAMDVSEGSEKDVKRALLSAQSSIYTYLNAAPVWEHMNKVVVFNDMGVSFECVRKRNGDVLDVPLLLKKAEYKDLDFSRGIVVRSFFSDSLNTPHEDVVVAYGKVEGLDAYIYAEASMQIFSSLFENETAGNIYIKGGDDFIYPSPVEEDFLTKAYTKGSIPLLIPSSSVVYYVDKYPMILSSSYGLTMFLTLLAGSALLALIVSLLTSRYMTKSSSKLINHIKYLTESNDFGYTDPSIEDGGDEIAEIGKTLNRMSLSISELLKRNEDLFEEKKDMELSMLQMQVNPHFLYNTLESIHYLADLRKEEGIATMSRGLSHLLKNIAKGNSDKITLAEELELIKEYDDIQQVRYMGMYEIVMEIPEELLSFNIQKFTLQPLVENAIFHGIEPSGRFGIITISAHKDDSFLYIEVKDDGIGLSKEGLAHIFEDKKSALKRNMTGVGIRNINERLKITYGESAGLSFTSVERAWTRATVKIPLEREDV